MLYRLNNAKKQPFNHKRRSVKKDVLKIFCRFHKKTPVLKSLCHNVASLKSRNFITKDTSTRVFSCEIGEILKNTYLEEHLRTTASSRSAPTMLMKTSLFVKSQAGDEIYSRRSPKMPSFRNFQTILL